MSSDSSVSCFTFSVKKYERRVIQLSEAKN